MEAIAIRPIIRLKVGGHPLTPVLCRVSFGVDASAEFRPGAVPHLSSEWVTTVTRVEVVEEQKPCG